LELLAAELDLELIAGLQAQLGGVGLADHQVAVELHPGGEAQLAACFGHTTTPAVTEADVLGFQQGLLKGGEVQALAAVHLGADIAGGANQIGFLDIAELLDLGEQFGSSEHGERKKLSGCMITNRLEL
jgi:hypothetical protein